VEIRSVTKAIRLLEELAKERSDCGVSELARTLGMDKSSVSRMLRTLEQSGFVAQNATTQRYSLGLTLAALGYQALKRVNLRDSSRSTLESLAAETGECSHLAVMAEDRAFYVEQVSPAWGVSVDAPVGTLAPLYCTALGKVLLTWQAEARQDQLFSEMTFESFTRRTIMDVNALRAHVVGIRQKGVAYDDEEFSVGVRCIAAPVFRHDGAICGAIGISGPSPRVTDEKMDTWGELLRRKAADLSARLGYREALAALV